MKTKNAFPTLLSLMLFAVLSLTSCQKNQTAPEQVKLRNTMATVFPPYQPGGDQQVLLTYNLYNQSSIAQTNNGIAANYINDIGTYLQTPKNTASLQIEFNSYDAIQVITSQKDSANRIVFQQQNVLNGQPVLSQASVDKINEVLLSIQHSTDGLQYAVKRVKQIVDNYTATSSSSSISQFSLEKAIVMNILNQSLAYGMHLYVIQRQYNALQGLPPHQNDPTDPMRLACKVNWGNVWRGAVIGGVLGAVTGTKIGLAGGTVTLPGIGTVAGAVGGGVFGFVGGYVGGAGTSFVAELMASCFRGHDPSKVKIHFFFPSTKEAVVALRNEIDQINTLPMPTGGGKIITF